MSIKKFKEMPCPVCNEFYFEDDTPQEKMEPGYDGKKDAFCIMCGWQYDLYQFEHPDAGNLTNELSLNEYKKWYKEKIKENPNYKFTLENYTKTSHLCPVCGKYEFADKNSFDICPFCGWEDDEVQEDDPDYWGGANDLSLNDCRKIYKEKIKENPNYMRFKK